MSAKHTPGPWKLCYDGQIDGVGGSLVVRLRFESFKDFEDLPHNRKADYRLIAAAPDLLAVAVKVAALRGTLEMHGLLDELTSAIAKAKGEAA